MEIVIGEGAKGVNNPDEQCDMDEFVKESILSAHLMIFNLVLEGRNEIDEHSMSPPQRWQKGIPSALENEREYREIVLNELANRQKGRDRFYACLDVLLIEGDEKSFENVICLERWELVSNGYQCPPGESLSTDILRILNRRLMTLVRTLYAFLVTFLPDVVPIEACDLGIRIYFHLHDEEGYEYHSNQTSLTQQYHQLVSHPRSSLSMTISVRHFFQQELHRLVSSLLLNQEDSLPLSPFDECLVNDRSDELVLKAISNDAVLSEFFFGELIDDDASATYENDREQDLRAFYSTLPLPSLSD